MSSDARAHAPAHAAAVLQGAGWLCVFVWCGWLAGWLGMCLSCLRHAHGCRSLRLHPPSTWGCASVRACVCICGQCMASCWSVFPWLLIELDAALIIRPTLKRNRGCGIQSDLPTCACTVTRFLCSLCACTCVRASRLAAAGGPMFQETTALCAFRRTCCS